MSRASRAEHDFMEQFACSQAVLLQFAEQLGLDRDQAVRIASAFGGGMGQAETCGVLTGAYMVLGLARSGETCAESEGRREVSETIREFNRRFLDQHGNLTCRNLLLCDISTPEGLAKAESLGLHESVCSRLVQSAVEILEDLLPTE